MKGSRYEEEEKKALPGEGEDIGEDSEASEGEDTKSYPLAM